MFSHAETYYWIAFVENIIKLVELLSLVNVIFPNLCLHDAVTTNNVMKNYAATE